MAPMNRALIAMGLLVAGCAYEPPVRDRSAPAYQTDLSACQDSGRAAVNARNAKTGLAWFSSPVRRPFQIREAVRACMEGKGYKVER